jgi:hypothetical protein
MKKSSKRFTLTTDAVNSYGFRVLTKGVDLTLFKSNPLMLWMHRRALGGTLNEVLPLGFWDNLQYTEGSITGVPVFDDTDSFATGIYNKVENGTIKMASAGFRPVEWSDKPEYKLPGQSGPTLISSQLEEVSLVDIGANADALAVTLYNNTGGIIQLSTLAGIADPYILKLAAKSWDELDRQGGMKELKAASPDLYAKKFNERFGHYPAGFEALANLSASTGGHSPYVLKLFAKSYYELHHSDGLLQLKNLAPDLYRTKFYEQYGKYPN